MKYLTTIIYSSSFIVEASSKKEALKLFQLQQKENFFIGIYPNNNSLSHNGNELVKYFMEEMKIKSIKVYECLKCKRFTKNQNQLCRYCVKS